MMKIISKYKDYYDYLQSEFGVDEKLILNRVVQGDNPNNIPNFEGVHTLVICGKFLEFICFEGKYYFGEEIKKFDVKRKNSWNKDAVYEIKFSEWARESTKYVLYPELSEDTKGAYKNFKHLLDECPIFMFSLNSERITKKFPSLETLGINKVIPAKEIWLMLSEWLGQQITKKEPSVPIGDDKVRILSAGFDLKTSFRKR